MAREESNVLSKIVDWTSAYLSKVSRYHFRVDSRVVVVRALVEPANRDRVELIVCDPIAHSICRRTIQIDYTYGPQWIRQRVVYEVRELARQMAGTYFCHNKHKGE